MSKLQENGADCNAARNDMPPPVPVSRELPTCPPGRNGDGRFARGNVEGFAPGNLAALTHGAYSQQVQAGELPEQAEFRAALAEKKAAIIADLGGDDAVGVLAVDTAGRYVALQMLEDYLTRNIIANGPLTPKGRARAALSALLAVSDRLTKLALALGLERKARPVDPLAAVRLAVQEANR